MPSHPPIPCTRHGVDPSSANPPGLHRRALLAALPGALGMLWPTAPVRAADAALPPPDAEVRRTQAQLDTLNRLLAQARQAEGSAERLQAALQGLASQWQSSQAVRLGGGSRAPLPTALAALNHQTLPGLAAVQTAWLAAVRQVDNSAQAHLAAVQRVLRAPKARRAQAMARLDAAAAARRSAETAERAARQAVDEAMQQGILSLDDLGDRWSKLGATLADTAGLLRQSVPDWASLHAQWQALQAAARAADQASAPLPALPQATAPWSAPAAWSPPQAPGIERMQVWRGGQERADQAQLAQWLQADALAAVQQALVDASCRRPGAGVRRKSRRPCTAWQNDAARLQSALAAQQTALVQARGVQTIAAASQRAQWTAAQPQLQTMLDWQDSLAPAATTAGGQALRALQAAIATSQATVVRLSQAQRQAEDAWIAAWRQQYGTEPPRSVSDMTAQAQVLGPTGMMAGMAPMLSSHALHRMHTRGDEPTGFGAYTYVLVGAGVRPDTPGVFARLQRLLRAVESLPIARKLSDELRAQANTFVVPVPPDNDDSSRLVVDLTLAQSLLSHLPPVLRLADIRQQLYLENGPFLITLPGRLADARADWPLLFADLSRAPEAVVADVVRRYMADLIGSFNPATTSWRPPAGMQVAISLVRLVKGSGDVAQAVFGGARR